jgi:hypothetical protein
MAAFSGFWESHEPPPLADEYGVVPAHHHSHQNDQQSGFILHCCFVRCHQGGRRGSNMGE